jgi:release factor glutamine methyltransferase
MNNDKVSQDSKIYLKTSWKESAQRLRKVGVKTPLLDARLLLQHVLDITYEELLISAKRELTELEIAKYEELLLLRLKRKPVSKILGQKEFWGLNFKVTEDTLDPRPDSETMILAVKKAFEDKDKELRILDLGTGSGCLLLTLLNEYPNATGIGADTSLKALSVATENSETLGFAKRADFIKSDWLKNVKGRFDIIVCNPPYIKKEALDYLPAEVRLYDPKQALDGGKDGMIVYRKLTPQLADYLTINGRCYYEIGKWQEHLVSDIINDSDYKIYNSYKDLAGVPRVIEFSKPFLKVIK